MPKASLAWESRELNPAEIRSAVTILWPDLVPPPAGRRTSTPGPPAWRGAQNICWVRRNRTVLPLRCRPRRALPSPSPESCLGWYPGRSSAPWATPHAISLAGGSVQALLEPEQVSPQLAAQAPCQRLTVRTWQHWLQHPR